MHHAAILLGLCLMATATLSHADESAWRNFMAAATDAAKRGDQSAAAANYENAVKAAAAFTASDTRLAAALYGLGRAKRAQHDNAAAEHSYLRAMAILDASPEASDAVRAELFNALGDVSRVQGRYKLAEDYYLSELAQLAKLHGADSAAVATALSNNMASLYRAQGRRDEAEAAYLRALALLEKGVPAEDEQIGRAHV